MSARPGRPRNTGASDGTDVAPALQSHASERLPRADRIRKRADFLRTQQAGRRVSTPHFLIMVLPAERQRLGITVTRRIAGAVGRNRIRRLAREVFRRNRACFPASCQLVLLARAGADQLDYATLQAELAAARGAMSRAAAAPAGRNPKTSSSS